jgi:hypothetical protein
MPLVQCRYTDCVNCDIGGEFACKADAITISDDWDEGCSAYEDYRDQPDYQNEYWIAVETLSGESAKVKVYRGKRIEYKGRVFYTSDRLEYAWCLITDAETGLGCGAYYLLEERFDLICERAKKVPKVETLPEAEWTSGGYELVKGEHHD